MLSWRDFDLRKSRKKTMTSVLHNARPGRKVFRKWAGHAGAPRTRRRAGSPIYSYTLEPRQFIKNFDNLLLFCFLNKIHVYIRRSWDRDKGRGGVDAGERIIRDFFRGQGHPTADAWNSKKSRSSPRGLGGGLGRDPAGGERRRKNSPKRTVEIKGKQDGEDEKNEWQMILPGSPGEEEGGGLVSDKQRHEGGGVSEWCEAGRGGGVIVKSRPITSYGFIFFPSASGEDPLDAKLSTEIRWEKIGSRRKRMQRGIFLRGGRKTGASGDFRRKFFFFIIPFRQFVCVHVDAVRDSSIASFSLWKIISFITFSFLFLFCFHFFFVFLFLMRKIVSLRRRGVLYK